MRPHLYELRRPATDAEWDRYHAIRKSSLFDTYHPWIPYDRLHPDERLPDNHPLGLFLDGAIIGTVRVDLKADGRAVLRMLAIADGLRGHHLGSRMLDAAEAYARQRGADLACLNAVAPAIRFYARHGYAPYRWQGCTRCPSSLPVAKPLALAADTVAWEGEMPPEVAYPPIAALAAPAAAALAAS